MITTQLMNVSGTFFFAAISDCRVAAAAAFQADYSRTSLQEQSLNENIFWNESRFRQQAQRRQVFNWKLLHGSGS